jgi:hypothetical protein
MKWDKVGRYDCANLIWLALGLPRKIKSRRIVEEFLYSISTSCVLTYPIGILRQWGNYF